MSKLQRRDRARQCRLCGATTNKGKALCSTCSPAVGQHADKYAHLAADPDPPEDDDEPDPPPAA